MMRHRSSLGLALLPALVWAAPSLAEPSAAQRATAEAIFQQGTHLMDEQRFAEACEKFAASQELDPGLGTQLYLADCYDRAGRTASAWALFREVEDRAHRANQTDRERIAKERAAALEGKLSRLELRVPQARQIPGLQLFSAGNAVPDASWNASLPVDPGLLRIEARAPGKKPWVTQVRVEPGTTGKVLEIPALVDAPRPKAPPSSSTPAGSDGSAQRAAGIVVGSAGLLALAAGGFFGYRAYTRNQESKGECRADLPNACTPDGARLREQATDAAKLSTILSVSGAGLFATGVTLVLTAPGPSEERRSQRRGEMATAWGVQVGGVW